MSLTTMMWLFVPLFLLALVHYVVAVRNYGLLTPDGLFVAMQLLMVYGTLRLVNENSPVDTFYARLMTGAVAVYIAASLITFVRLSSRQPRNLRAYSVTPTAPTRQLLLGLGVSIAITVAYFIMVGYSAFLVGLEGRLHGEAVDIATLRLESYAGTRYLFPGYVNQFKNVMLPSLTLVLATWSHNRPGTFAKICSWALVGFSALALLWTGQRGAFISFLLTTLVFAFLYNRRRLPRAALLTPLVGIPLALLSTFVLDRGDSTSGDFITRIVSDNQDSGIAAFRYTSQLPVQNGKEWLQRLTGILPGQNGGRTLDGDVFAILYGSDRGTAPPSLWGSIHYNFDTIGVVAAAAILGVLFQTLTSRSMRRHSYNSLQLVGFSGITVVLGTWVAGGPDTLLNTGLVAYLGIWLWGNRIRLNQKEVPQSAVDALNRSSIGDMKRMRRPERTRPT